LIGEGDGSSKVIINVVVGRCAGCVHCGHETHDFCKHVENDRDQWIRQHLQSLVRRDGLYDARGDDLAVIAAGSSIQSRESMEIYGMAI
jgi:hypothetical protein